MSCGSIARIEFNTMFDISISVKGSNNPEIQAQKISMLFYFDCESKSFQSIKSEKELKTEALLQDIHINAHSKKLSYAKRIVVIVVVS